MAYNAKGQKIYNQKSIQFNTVYRPGTDIAEGQRLKAYLESTGQSANSYIKGLIKRDLDSKKIETPKSTPTILIEPIEILDPCDDTIEDDYK